MLSATHRHLRSDETVLVLAHGMSDVVVALERVFNAEAPVSSPTVLLDLDVLRHEGILGPSGHHRALEVELS